MNLLRRRFTVGTTATVWHGVKDAVTGTYISATRFPFPHLSLVYEVEVEASYRAFTEAHVSPQNITQAPAFGFSGTVTPIPFTDRRASYTCPLCPLVPEGNFVQERQTIQTRVDICVSGVSQGCDCGRFDLHLTTGHAAGSGTGR